MCSSNDDTIFSEALTLSADDGKDISSFQSDAECSVRVTWVYPILSTSLMRSLDR